MIGFGFPGQLGFGEEEHPGVIFGGADIHGGVFTGELHDALFRRGKLDRLPARTHVELRGVVFGAAAIPAAFAARPVAGRRRGHFGVRGGEEDPRTVRRDRAVGTALSSPRAEDRAATAQQGTLAVEVHELQRAARGFAEDAAVGSQQRLFRRSGAEVVTAAGEEHMGEIARGADNLCFFTRRLSAHPVMDGRILTERRVGAAGSTEETRLGRARFAGLRTHEIVERDEGEPGRFEQDVPIAGADILDPERRRRERRGRPLPPFGRTAENIGAARRSGKGAKSIERFKQEPFTVFRRRTDILVEEFLVGERQREHVAAARLLRRRHELIGAIVGQPRDRRRQSREHPFGLRAGRRGAERVLGHDTKTVGGGRRQRPDVLQHRFHRAAGRAARANRPIRDGRRDPRHSIRAVFEMVGGVRAERVDTRPQRRVGGGDIPHRTRSDPRGVQRGEREHFAV